LSFVDPERLTSSIYKSGGFTNSEFVNDRDEIDPESRLPLEALLEQLPGAFCAISDINERRSAVTALLNEMRADLQPSERVVIKDFAVPSPDGAPDIKLHSYRPSDASEALPGLYYIHGGGMILGSVDSDDPIASMLCETLGIEVFSVEYRLAPENPYPAAVEDCYTGLK